MERVSFIPFSTTVFCEFFVFFFVSYCLQVSNGEEILCYSEGGGDYMTATIIIGFDFKKFKILLFFFCCSFPRGIRFTPISIEPLSDPVVRITRLRTPVPSKRVSINGGSATVYHDQVPQSAVCVCRPRDTACNKKKKKTGIDI